MTTHICDLTPDAPPLLGELGGDCPCGRGPTIGTCTWTSGRLWFRAFHDGPVTFHLENTADWACLDCIADTALAIASGEVRDAMRRIARERRAQPEPAS